LDSILSLSPFQVSALLKGLERIEGDGKDRQRKLDEKLSEVKANAIAKKAPRNKDGSINVGHLIRMAK
jgi:hypothetical protein